MTTPRRQSEDFRWPVPPSELDDIEVLEEPFDTAGRPLWRRPAAGADTLAPADEGTAATDAPRPVAAGGVPSPALPVPSSSPTTGWQDVLPFTWGRVPTSGPLRAWSGAAERAGLLVAGVLIGMAAARVGLPDLAGDATFTLVPNRPVPPGQVLLAGASTSLPPTVLAVAPPSSTQVRGGQPPVPVAAPVQAPAADTARRVGAGGAALVPARRPAPRAADDIPRASSAILGPVQEYAVAVSRLDARATQVVFPSVDRDRLVQRFTGLREQRLTLARCTAAVAGTQAMVTCRGTLRYRPRVGDHSTRIERAQWRFSLSDDGGTWKIRSVDPS